ncbi:MAG: sigma-70 family RNA polymerase sigma factor [Planctomycetota bacterium]
MSNQAGEPHAPLRLGSGLSPGPGPASFAGTPSHSGLDLHQVWESNRRWVAAVILAYKPRWADLEDLLQDVATSLVAHSAELRDPTAVKPWLRSVAINAARLAGRKGKLRLHQSLDESFPGEGTAGRLHEPAAGRDPSAPGRQDDASAVAQLALQLPESYREPLLLKAVQGLSYRQISQILGLPETTIETRIARGRRMLRELAAQGGVSPATSSGD